MAKPASGPIRISAAAYRGLLLAYPPAHRRLYGRWMRQLFRDLCHDAYAENGCVGLGQLWLRTLPDLAASLPAAYWEAAEEALMVLNRAVAPVAWGKVALVVVPGLLFGLSRVVGPLGLPAGLSFLLIAVLAGGALVVQRRLPVWGLLALGLLTGWALQWLSLQLPGELTRGLFKLNLPATTELGTRLLFSPDLQPLIAAVPLWLASLWLLWKYRPVWRSAAWILALSGLVMGGAAVLVDVNVLLEAGLVLLPVALGLPLSRQSGSLASLYALGAFSTLVLSDSDYHSAGLLRAQPFYPLYVIPLVWMLVSVAPLLLLRAQTLRGQAAGLLAPALVWGIARIAVPWLFQPDFHPLAIWLGEAWLSASVLLVLALAFHLYSQSGNPTAPAGDVRAGQAVYTG